MSPPTPTNQPTLSTLWHLFLYCKLNYRRIYFSHRSNACCMLEFRNFLWIGLHNLIIYGYSFRNAFWIPPYPLVYFCQTPLRSYQRILCCASHGSVDCFPYRSIPEYSVVIPPLRTASTGNGQFAQDIAEWTFQSSLVVAIAEAKHYIAGDQSKTQLDRYTVNTQVRLFSLLFISSPSHHAWNQKKALLKPVHVSFYALGTTTLKLIG